MKTQQILASAIIYLATFSLPAHAQYRPRHADVTRKMIHLLPEPKKEDYYFALLPKELHTLVSKNLRIARDCKKTLVDELKKVPELAQTKQFFQFLLWFPHLFGTRALLRDSDEYYKNIHFVRAFVATGGKLRKISLSEVISCDCPDATQIVRVLLEAGAHPQKIDEGFNYPLVEAVRIGSQECVELLLNAGAQCDAHREIGRKGIIEWTPLVGACRNGHVKIVQLLLAKGANVNYVGRYHKLSALNAAVMGNHPDIVRLLLSKGADIHYRAEASGSSLELAIGYGNIECAQILLDAGCDPNPLERNKKNRLKDCLPVLCPPDKYEAIRRLLDRY